MDENDDGNLYSFDIAPERKRVFVTQLRDDEEDEDVIKKIPIVKEKAGRLVELGFNTLQKTLLLKRQADLSKIDIDYQEKKQEFKRRMEKCKKKELEIQSKRNTLNERIEKFRVYCEENDGKRQRAISKFVKEEKMKNKKKEELEILKDELQILLERLESLKLKISKYAVFEKFLCLVVDSLPEDYLEMTDNMLNALLMRYQTLLETNHSLIAKREHLTKQIQERQEILQDSPVNQAQHLLLCNKELKESRTHLEKLCEKNKRLEVQNANKKMKYISTSETLGQIKLSIENLASMCGQKSRNDNDGRHLSLEQQLHVISEHIKERESVYNMSSSIPPDEKPPEKNSIRYTVKNNKEEKFKNCPKKQVKISL